MDQPSIEAIAIAVRHGNITHRQVVRLRTEAMKEAMDRFYFDVACWAAAPVPKPPFPAMRDF